ncbi:hypothetical protein V8C26DRAFT_387876 [Trichoderma gracile]
MISRATCAVLSAYLLLQVAGSCPSPASSSRRPGCWMYRETCLNEPRFKSISAMSNQSVWPPVSATENGTRRQKTKTMSAQGSNDASAATRGRHFLLLRVATGMRSSGGRRCRCSGGVSWPLPPPMSLFVTARLREREKQTSSLGPAPGRVPSSLASWLGKILRVNAGCAVIMPMSLPSLLTYMYRMYKSATRSKHGCAILS